MALALSTNNLVTNDKSEHLQAGDTDNGAQKTPQDEVQLNVY